MPKVLFMTALFLGFLSISLFFAAYIKFSSELVQADQFTRELLSQEGETVNSTSEVPDEKVLYLLKNRLDKATRELNDTSSAMGEISKDKNKLERIVDDLESQILQARTEADDSVKKETELAALKQSSADLEAQHKVLSERANLVEQEKETLLANMEALTAERDGMKSNFKAKAEEISNLTSEIEMLQGTLAKGQVQQVSIAATLDKVSNEKLVLVRKVMELESQTVVAQELKDKFIEREAELDTLKQNASDLEELHQGVSERASLVEQEKETLLANLQLLTDERDELKFDFGLKTEEISKLSSEITSLKNTLTEEEIAQAAAESEMNDILKEKVKLERLVSDLETQVSMGKQQASELTKRENELSLLQENSTKLEQQQIELLQNTNLVEQEKETLLANLQLLTDERDELKFDFGLKTEEISKLSSEIASLKNTLTEEEIAQAAVESEMNDILKEKVKLERLVSDLETQVSMGKQQASELTKRENELSLLQENSTKLEQQQIELLQKINLVEQEKATLVFQMETLAESRDALEADFDAKTGEMSALSTELATLKEALAREEGAQALVAQEQTATHNAMRDLELQLEHMTLERDGFRERVGRLEVRQVVLTSEILALSNRITKYKSFQSDKDKVAMMIPSGGLSLKKKDGKFGFDYDNDQGLDLKYEVSFATETASTAKLRDRPIEGAGDRVFIPFSEEMLGLIQGGEPIDFRVKIYNVFNDKKPTSWKGKFKLDLSTNMLVWMGA